MAFQDLFFLLEEEFNLARDLNHIYYSSGDCLAAEALAKEDP